ncbi:MAG: 2-amino-4-hydroxy-6-hydroxymethyldihydropteridine diphosphokinase [Gammaproteobacteria bacterium]
MAKIFIAVGSNEAPGRNIDKALESLGAFCKDIGQSPWYVSPAVGAAKGEFVNLVVGANTELSAEAVVANLKSIELQCGRTASNQTLDLDLLLYDDFEINDGAVRIPRIDIERYAFVLKPLAELAPNAVHPVLKKKFSDMWHASEMDASGLKRVTRDELR